MAARKRKEGESFKNYRLSLQAETEREKKRDKKYLVAHRLFDIPDKKSISGFITKVVGNTYRRPAFKP